MVAEKDQLNHDGKAVRITSVLDETRRKILSRPSLRLQD